jgi:hypothetical protein
MDSPSQTQTDDMTTHATAALEPRVFSSAMMDTYDLVCILARLMVYLWGVPVNRWHVAALWFKQTQT